MNEVGAFAKRKCPCCNNPWNIGDSVGDQSLTPVCTPCLGDDKGYKGLDPANFDPSVNLKENFFMWSNGMWMKNNPIPKEYPSWNTFIALHTLNLERLKDILSELQNSTETLDADGVKLADFYNSFMDEETVESR